MNQVNVGVGRAVEGRLYALDALSKETFNVIQAIELLAAVQNEVDGLLTDVEI